MPAMLVVSLAIIFLGGCYNGTTLDLSQDIEITGEVTFSRDVIPVFEKNCSISGCHNTNGISLDLSSDRAYNALANGGYIGLWMINASGTIVDDFGGGNS